MKKVFACIFCFMLSVPFASAHPGNTDENGGHLNYSTGEYHYHHGYPAHQHADGICPYEAESPLSMSNESPESNIPAWENTTQNGIYEEAYNLGYSDFFWDLKNDLLAQGEDVSWVSGVSERLIDENSLDGETPLSEIGYIYADAYNDGYLEAELDFDRLPEEPNESADNEEGGIQNSSSEFNASIPTEPPGADKEIETNEDSPSVPHTIFSAAIVWLIVALPLCIVCHFFVGFLAVKLKKGDVYEYITRSFTVTSLISFAFYELIALCSSYQFEPFSTESLVITLIVLIIGCAVAFFADIIAQKIK